MIERVNRLFLVFIDHIVSCFIAFTAPALFIVFGVEGSILFNLVWSLGFVLYLNKDIIDGKSYAKRKFSFSIVTEGNKGLNSTICMLRNLTAPLFLIEIIFLFYNPKKRSVDYILGTKVVSDIGNGLSEDYKIDWKGTLILSAIVMIVTFILITLL